MATPYTTAFGEFARPTVTLRQIAEKAGVSYSFVAKIAQGHKPCSRKVQEAVEKLTGVPWQEVFPPERRRR